MIPIVTMTFAVVVVAAWYSLWLSLTARTALPLEELMVTDELIATATDRSWCSAAQNT